MTGERNDTESRLSELGEKLERAHKRHNPPPRERQTNAIGLAYRMTIEMVVGLVVGGFIGWWIDSIFETKVLFLIIFLLLGFAAGIANVMRTAKELNAGGHADSNLGNSEPTNVSERTDKD